MKKEIKKAIELGKSVVYNKDVRVWSTIILLAAILIISSQIRMNNIYALKDTTNGEYVMADPDATYFLRVAEAIHNNENSLPPLDSMRYVSMNASYSNELTPRAITWIYEVLNIYDETTVAYAAVIYPVVFFFLGTLVFFFLILYITKSKFIALISTAALSVVPSYLFRTMSGVADHEPIGMFSFYLTMLLFIFSMDFLKKICKNKSIKTILLAILFGEIMAFMIVAWSGIALLFFIIYPLSFLLIWLLDENKEDLKYFLMFYYISFFVAILSTVLLYNYVLSNVLTIMIISSTSVLNGLLFAFLIIDYLLINYKDKISEKIYKYRILISLVISIIVGLTLLSLTGVDVLLKMTDFITRIFNPLGIERISTTVSENSQMYLVSWYGQIGIQFFYLFLFGVLMFGIDIALSSCEKTKTKVIFALTWVAMIFGLLYSKYAPTGTFNGATLVSNLFYFCTLMLFLGYCVYLFIKKEINISPTYIIVMSWIILMLVAGRGAIRLFFVITPLICFMSVYLIYSLFKRYEVTEDDTGKLLIGVVAIIFIILSGFTMYSFYNGAVIQSKQIGPVSNYQWQNSMAWVRDNTAEGSIFVGWWDFGYLIQYSGQRPSVTDGGHYNAHWDHLIARYLLTTPTPETALSFMKSQNVSFLFFDPADIGKYPAFSKIGSDHKEDRYSWIPTLLNDPKQTQETKDSIKYVYPAGFQIDTDIIYEINGSAKLLAKQNTGLGGVNIEINNNGTFKQPVAIYVSLSSGIQTHLPMRYVYYDGHLVDFKSGLNQIFYIIPSLNQDANGGVQLNNIGAAIFLSEKVSDGLFARLYLLNDPFKQYTTISVAHTQQDQVVDILRSQGAAVGEFIYFNGLRAPLKIYKVNYPNSTLIKEEFLSLSGGYAELDNLIVTSHM